MMSDDPILPAFPVLEFLTFTVSAKPSAGQEIRQPACPIR
jgi:hypothetical protein